MARPSTCSTSQTQPLFAELLQRVTEQRQPCGSHTNLFYRMAPERWLESLVIRQVRAIDERLDQRFVYSQVPAFAAADRAMLDVLTCTLDGRLAVLELKANEDIHLPLQGLDYWARVRWHQQHGEFTRNGYFAGRELSSAPPILYLVAPALRVHPTTDVLLRYLSPRIEWNLAQVDERWREGVRVVNRKHPGSVCCGPSDPSSATRGSRAPVSDPRILYNRASNYEPDDPRQPGTPAVPHHHQRGCRRG